MSKSFKLYGTNYELSPTSSVPADCYGYKGAMVDDVPKGAKMVGYITTKDSSVVECYKKFNKLIVVIPIVLVALIVGAIVLYYMKFQKKDVEIFNGLLVKTGDDTNVVSYNGFMSVFNGSVDITFTNGDTPATIYLVGEGITCEPVTLEPGETLDELPITYDTDEGLVQVELVIKTETSETKQNVLIEVPENNTPNSPDKGLDGFWRGEAVYGIDVPATE